MLKKLELLKTNLQLFAEGEGEGSSTGEGEGSNEGNKETGGETKETYTKAEVEAMLQKEADRRVSAARKKFELELNSKLDKERKEAEKLSTLSAEERAKHTIEEQKKKLDLREQELLQKEMKLETIKIISEKDLPVNMIDMLVGIDAEQTMNNIEAFEVSFRKAVEESVNKRLGSTSGTPGSGASGQLVNKEDFKKLDYRGRLELMNKDKDLYNKLSKEFD